MTTLNIYPHERPKGWIEWMPHAATRTVLAQVQDVLAQYREHLPLTIRQVFYRLVALYGYDKTERAYSRLCEYMNKARRAGIVDFDHIRCDGWQQGVAPGFDGPQGFWDAVRSTAEHYRRNKQTRQPQSVFVLVEAAGMRPQIERVASVYCAPVYSSGGFDSLTAKKALADVASEAGRPCVFLHIGDLDPSGVCIFDAMAADVQAFCSSTATPRFERVAITPEQVAHYNLPTAPPKAIQQHSPSVRPLTNPCLIFLRGGRSNGKPSRPHEEKLPRPSAIRGLRCRRSRNTAMPTLPFWNNSRNTSRRRPKTPVES